MTTDTLTAERLAAIEEELTEAAPAGPLFDDDGFPLYELDMGAVRALISSAREAERLRAEVEALRNAADYARNKIMLGSIQGRKSDRDEHLREAYNTLYPALEEHTNGR